jgi:hypothetical protein
MNCHCAYVRWSCILLLAGCQPIAAPRGDQVSQPNATETYTHPPSRFNFPPMVAGFARETVKQYDREGRDVSVGYNQGQAVAMTVYIYPVPQGGSDANLEGHFQNCKREVLSHHQAAGLLSENQVTVPPGGQKHSGWRAAFSYTERFAQQQQTVRSDLYLFFVGPWFIKYRVTYPEGQEATAEPVINAFIDELAWPEETRG